MPSIASKSTLEVETAPGSGVFFKVAKITNMPKPKPTKPQVDVTNMDSDAEEQIPGLPNYGQLVYNLIWEPGSAVDAFVSAWDISNEIRAVRQTYGKTGVKDTYQGFVLEYDAGAGGASEAFKGSITIKCTSVPVRS